MRELKQLITGLIRGEQSFEKVSQALDHYLASTPAGAENATRLLRAARKAGLPHHLFVALNGQVSTPVKASADPDATSFAVRDPQATTAAPDTAGRADVTSPARPGEPTRSPSAAHAAGDPDATVFAADDDRRARATADTLDLPGSEVTLPGGQADETVLGPGSGDDHTLMADAAQGTGEFDILSADALDAAGRVSSIPTGASRPTAPPGTAGTVAGVDREFHEGDLLRGRFELISKLGEGGMGAVWKGKDKLKEEARDRNPFVAIKLLQRDFKAHPEAFIALQRETAKQQRLAHPNIATVYDFDRDDATSTVFMTMEVLEGQPLDAFIRKLPADGLPEEEAMPLIEQLCNGLSYAHQASLVHSDLKPGNCFLTQDGSIKLLDFGIARASKTKGDAEGETTLFDPGSLGALTPTYATIEMFEGEDPDPRDDIYALAIMAYQMLTGKHPYAKKSAPKAKELGLRPEPIAKLSKSQNRGLARALAFHREDRTSTVEEFLDSITRKNSRTGLWAATALLVMALIAAGAWGPITSYLDRQQREDVITQLQQGDLEDIANGLAQARALGLEQLELVLDDERTVNAIARHIAAGGQNVQTGLNLLAAYPAAWQQRVKEVDAARDAIFTHYENAILRAFAPAEQRFDFPAARHGVDALDAHYPDSAKVFQIRGDLEDSKQATLSDMSARYKDLKAAGALIPDERHDDISDVLAVVRTIDPDHRLLRDRDLPFRFAEETEKAIRQDRDYARASALLAASVAHAPDDAKLKGLRYDLDRILTRIENEKRIADLETRLGQAEPRLRSLADFQGVRDELVALADLSARSPVRLRIQARLITAFDAELQRLTAAGQWQQAEELLFGFARLLGIADLTARRIALSEAQGAAGFSPDLDARRERVEERVASVNELLARPEFTTDWETRLKVPYKELIALLPLGSPELEKVRTDTARLMLSAARQARGQENFNQAREFVAKGLEFYPGLSNFSDESAAIDADEKAFLARRAEDERLAKVQTLKSEFTESTSSNEVQVALRALAEMRSLGVPEEDEFLATIAPGMLSLAYQRLATQAASNDDYLSAAELARQALKYDPDLQGLAASLESYEAEIKKREREIRLAKLFNGLEPLDVKQVQQVMATLQADYPQRFEKMTQTFIRSRGGQLRRYALTRSVDVGVLAARASEFSRLFPAAGAELGEELADSIEPRLRNLDVTSPARLAGAAKPLAAFAKLAPQRHSKLRDDLADRALDAIRDLERTDKSAAAALARAARSTFAGNRELAALSIVVPLQEVATGTSQMERNQLMAAAKNLAAARARDASHPDISPFASELDRRRRQADEFYARHLALAKDPLGYKQKGEIRELFRKAAGLCSDCGFKERAPPKPVAGLCHPGLAGFGAKRAGQCWDRVGRTKGPLMVVVPAGGSVGSAFAIGKYEVSGKDLNEFCKSSGRCKVILGSSSRLPATGISASLIEEYARWLSTGASKTLNQPVVYRLPTAAEWQYAASANGVHPEKTFNCRVTSGGNIIAGHDLVDARSGQENGWGLANYVGNARELVKDGSAYTVRGGDFAVPLTRCDVNVSEPHDGAAGPTTGFRLVRELAGE